jgi:hypothetical protein
LKDDDARALLGLSVSADGVELGTVGAAWVDRRDDVPWIEVRSARGSDTHYVPYATLSVREGTIGTSSLTVLRTGPTTFFAERGARRVAPAWAIGFVHADVG